VVLATVIDIGTFLDIMCGNSELNVEPAWKFFTHPTSVQASFAAVGLAPNGLAPQMIDRTGFMKKCEEEDDDEDNKILSLEECLQTPRGVRSKSSTAYEAKIARLSDGLKRYEEEVFHPAQFKGIISPETMPLAPRKPDRTRVFASEGGSVDSRKLREVIKQQKEEKEKKEQTQERKRTEATTKKENQSREFRELSEAKKACDERMSRRNGEEQCKRVGCSVCSLIRCAVCGDIKKTVCRKGGCKPAALPQADASSFVAF
jgi:valyl-tRNA synthetase